MALSAILRRRLGDALKQTFLGKELADAVDSVTTSSQSVTQTLTNKTLTDFIDTGAKVCTAQVDRASSTTLTTITGLSVNVTAAGKYIFRAHITGTSTANGGVKVAIGGTATATSITYTATNYNGTTINAKTTTTTLGNAVGAATAVFTDITIEGAIVVNAAGTLLVQIAQNASHADTTSAYVNSDFFVTRVA